VMIPLHPSGAKPVSFKLKKDALEYFRACKLELRRTRRIELLSSRQALVDAIEAMTMLKAISDRKKMRKAAALYLECLGAEAKLKGEKPAAPYSEPESRMVDLPPALYRGLTKIALAKGASLEDLVCGVLHSYVRSESEGLIPPTGKEEVYRMRTALYQTAA
jgi:predicted HicB family RNase H-like nuclease